MAAILSRPHCVNSVRPSDAFMRQETWLSVACSVPIHYLNQCWIPIVVKISPRFVPKGPTNNIPALVKIMAWRRPGDKPLSEPVIGPVTANVSESRIRIQQFPSLYNKMDLKMSPVKMSVIVYWPRCINNGKLTSGSWFHWNGNVVK